MTKKHQILVRGPQVVSRALKRMMKDLGLGGSDIHKKNGVTDNIANSEEALDQIKTFHRIFKIYTKYLKL